MAQPNPNISEIVATTIRNRQKAFSDLVSKHNALLTKLKARGKQKPFSGGTEIMHELEYSENSTFKWFSGYELLNIQPSEAFTAALFAIKQAAVAVTMSGLEQLQNASEEKMIDLLESRIDNAMHTMKNRMSQSMYSDGTGDGGKQITGLAALVSTTPNTGVTGGINRANHSWWRNLAMTADLDAAALSDRQAAQRDAWEHMYVALTRGSDRPDLIICDNEQYITFSTTLTDRQRYERPNSDMAKYGWETLAFKSADVVHDGGYGGFAPEYYSYFLNCDHLFFRPHSARDMEPLDSGRYSTNQDAMVQLIAWAGNMAMDNGFLQGIVHNG